MGLKDGSSVPADQWKSFLDTEVTPRFPNGLTVLDGYGQWRNATGSLTAEPSKILILLHPPDPGAHGKVEDIRARYKERFAQESVLRGTNTVKAAF